MIYNSLKQTGTPLYTNWSFRFVFPVYIVKENEETREREKKVSKSDELLLLLE
jgi:hypothetical protein